MLQIDSFAIVVAVESVGSVTGLFVYHKMIGLYAIHLLSKNESFQHSLLAQHFEVVLHRLSLILKFLIVVLLLLHLVLILVAVIVAVAVIEAAA